jgi:hypothetical protein
MKMTMITATIMKKKTAAWRQYSKDGSRVWKKKRRRRRRRRRIIINIINLMARLRIRACLTYNTTYQPLQQSSNNRIMASRNRRHPWRSTIHVNRAHSRQLSLEKKI